MTDRELMQQALETLEEINKLSVGENAICLPAEIDTAMDALRDRLAQPEQEPVAWGVFDGPNLHDMFFSEEEAQDLARLKGDGSVVKPLYAAPRPWVGLTDEEIKEIIGPWGDTPIKGYTRKLFDQIEAKLKEKNT